MRLKADRIRSKPIDLSRNLYRIELRLKSIGFIFETDQFHAGQIRSDSFETDRFESESI